MTSARDFLSQVIFLSAVLSATLIVSKGDVYAQEQILSLDKKYLNRLNSCSITDAATNNYEPANFSKSNNMLKHPEQTLACQGQPIVIYGQIVDHNCTPIPDVTIYAWQVGANGKYPYKPLKNIAEHQMYEIKSSDSFVGHGTAITNNEGEFYFLTIYPKSVDNLKPHINIRVQRGATEILQTRFELDTKSIVDKTWAKHSPFALGAVQLVYKLKIVVPAESSLRY